MNIPRVASSLAATVARLASGLGTGPLGKRPEKRLTLYDFEGCPFCRKAREAATMLDLELLVLPCPKGGPHYREELVKRGGKAQFPYLIDPNTGKEMYESDAIVAYLYSEYGNGKVPRVLDSGVLTDASSALATAMRGGAGTRYTPSKAPAEHLELWSFEASPFCRLVRESLTCHEIPYVLHNVGKDSPSREAFVKRSGKMMVPFLFDPNTGIEMFESEDIVVYLAETYGGREA